ncbi:hypothetical protein M0804_009168 [Polistes exclamans]|nr:hypothetical protein M0804_009168 [Polistes exclamans]
MNETDTSILRNSQYQHHNHHHHYYYSTTISIVSISTGTNERVHHHHHHHHQFLPFLPSFLPSFLRGVAPRDQLFLSLWLIRYIVHGDGRDGGTAAAVVASIGYGDGGDGDGGGTYVLLYGDKQARLSRGRREILETNDGTKNIPARNNPPGYPTPFFSYSPSSTSSSTSSSS